MPSLSPHNTALAARPLTLLALLTFSNLATAVPSSADSRSHGLTKRGFTYKGCFSSSQPLTNEGLDQYQAQSVCTPICAKSNSAVFGFSAGGYCWCGDELPAASSKVSDSNCNTPCFGYGDDMCGGTGYWSVWLTGTEANVPNYGDADSSGSSSSTSSASSSPSPSPSSSPSPSPSSSRSPASTPSSTTTAPPTVITSVAPGRTVVVTEPAKVVSSSTPSTKPKGGSSHTAGIAAGIVVGVLVLGAIIGGGVVFFLRQKRRRQAEDEYRQRSQADFMRSIERKGGSSFANTNDSRMDPEAGRRNSVGSLADNQDYSRRILRVANPDSS